MQVIQNRKWFYIISLIIIIPGLVSLFVQGLNLGIDFQGGSILHVKMEQSIQSADVRTTLQKINIENAEVQKSGDQFYIRTAELNQEQTKEMQSALKEEFTTVEFLGAESVGAAIGSELTRDAILALLIAAVLMLIYITIRFEWSFGVAAIVPIVHNVLIVIGVFSIFQWEISSSFIAAILTVIGYSINDTIIIFDRVRENMRYKLKEDRMTLLNKSILQTLNRSINTVLTSTFALVALLLFGGATLKIFVLAMLIGFVSGAYSSIFIASPIWYEIKSRA
ncbi:MAG TPA: protein translocase subunit SecF [Syntrophomonadaceae bacterium]|nr:protein translocase subunit SecF [Syntrophomonadaceae bacterium]